MEVNGNGAVLPPLKTAAHAGQGGRGVCVCAIIFATPAPGQCNEETHC